MATCHLCEKREATDEWGVHCGPCDEEYQAEQEELGWCDWCQVPDDDCCCGGTSPMAVDAPCKVGPY